jgi:osmoprotectant transport system substrate-binding protein
MPKSLTARSAAALAGAALLLTACGGGQNDPLQGGSGQGSAAPAAGDTIVVGSANFPENQILAEIYAQALAAKGVKVEKRLNIGSLTVADKAAAEDKDAVVVTRETATRLNLKSIEDLAPRCGELVFGGPPEFQERPDGIPGLKKTYNCEFKEYRSLDAGGPLTVGALKNGDVQAADLFTTDSAIPANDFVVLDDPKSNFAAQNVVPVINKAKANDNVKQVLNAVSAKLTTEGLTALNAEAASDAKPSPEAVAKGWLSKNSLA